MSVAVTEVNGVDCVFHNMTGLSKKFLDLPLSSFQDRTRTAPAVSWRPWRAARGHRTCLGGLPASRDRRCGGSSLWNTRV